VVKVQQVVNEITTKSCLSQLVKGIYQKVHW